MAKRSKSRWNIGSYSRFIKAARQRERLSVPEARLLYRVMRDRLSKPVFANDIRKNRQSVHTEAVLIKQESKQFEHGFSIAIPLQGHEITSLEEWEKIIDEWTFGYDTEYYEGTASYKSDEG